VLKSGFVDRRSLMQPSVKSASTASIGACALLLLLLPPMLCVSCNRGSARAAGPAALPPPPVTDNGDRAGCSEVFGRDRQQRGNPSKGVC